MCKWANPSKGGDMEYQELFEIALQAQQMAYAKYSKFKVGAAVKFKNGKVYSGCNIENASYGATVCAERVAIWKAISEGEKAQDIEALCLVTSTPQGDVPCGMCLQVLSEFMPKEAPLLIANSQGIILHKKWTDFLPHPFEL